MYISIHGTLPPLTQSGLERFLMETARSVFGPILPPNALIAETAAGAELPGQDFKLRAHPAAEPIAIYLRDPDIKSGSRVLLDAHTGTVGIGYHDAVIRWIDALGAAGVMWDPETDMSRDFAWQLVERDVLTLRRGPELYMARRLQECLETMNVSGLGYSFCLPVPLDGMERPTADLRLPIGARSLDWLRAAARNPDMARSILAWPNPGLSPAVLRDAAICSMWLDVPWCRPCDTRTAELYEYILSLLATAHQQDPALEMPWGEWLELATLSGAADSVPHSARRTTEPGSAGSLSMVGPIGYRRDPQCNCLPNGVQLQLPGSMLFAEQSDPNGWFTATDGPRSVRLQVKPQATPLSKEQQRAVILTPPTPAAATAVPEHYRAVETEYRFGAAFRWTESQTQHAEVPAQITVIQARYADASVICTLMFTCDDGTPLGWVDTALDSVSLPRRSKRGA